jgi:hypothetical protein
VRAIGGAASKSSSTADRALASIEKAGYLNVARTGGKGGTSRNSYSFRLPDEVPTRQEERPTQAGSCVPPRRDAASHPSGTEHSKEHGTQ